MVLRWCFHNSRRICMAVASRDSWQKAVRDRGILPQSFLSRWSRVEIQEEASTEKEAAK